MLLSAFFDLYVYNSTAGFPEYVCAYLFVYFAINNLIIILQKNDVCCYCLPVCYS